MWCLKSFSQLRQKILEAHANVKDLNLLEAKMNFKRWIAYSLNISWILYFDRLRINVGIFMKLFRAWESLPEYGVSLFVVKFHGEKKEELLVSHLFEI